MKDRNYIVKGMKRELVETLIKVFLVFILILIPINIVQGFCAEWIHELLSPFENSYPYISSGFEPPPLTAAFFTASGVMFRLRFYFSCYIAIGAILGALTGRFIVLVRELTTRSQSRWPVVTIFFVSIFAGVGFSTTIVILQYRLQLLTLINGYSGFLGIFLPIASFEYIYPLAVIFALSIAFFHGSPSSFRRVLAQQRGSRYFWYRKT